MNIPVKGIELDYNNLDEKNLKKVIAELYKIKSYIFKNTLSNIKYLKIYNETGEMPPFYKEVVRLNDIIKYLEFWEARLK